MKYLVLLFLFSIHFTFFAQRTALVNIPLDTDSVLYVPDSLGSFGERIVLVGNVILPATPGQNGAMIYFRKFETSDCQSHGEEAYHMEPHIISIESTDSTLVVEIQVPAYCGAMFIGDIRRLENDCLSLEYYDYGSFAACICCYGLRYEFEKFPADEGDDELKYVVINGDRSTQRSVEK